MNIIIPKSYGRWSDPDRAGNSIWFPDINSIPEKSNDPYRPYTFRQLIFLNIKKNYQSIGFSQVQITRLKINLSLLAMGIKGIRFINSEPDFSPFAIATVKLGSCLTGRYGGEGTMPEADKILAKKLRLTENQIRQWINDNQYVWHERRDGRRINLVCHDIHTNIPHTGGIAANKERMG
jgi:DNA-binding transcriptional MerR regulator